MSDEVRPGATGRTARSRRQILAAGTALVGGSLTGKAASAETSSEDAPPYVPRWMKEPGADVGSQPYGQPSPYEKDVIRNIPKGGKQYISSASRTPLQELDGIITPNGLFYERHHGGIPAIDPAAHRLMIHGLVERPLLLTMDELRRFPTESHIYFLECSGNPGFEVIKQGKTASDLVGLASWCEWTGVRIKTILDEVGV